MADTGKMIALIKAFDKSADPAVIENAVSDWLDDHITNPDSPPLDRSLTQSNAATPADITGQLKSAFDKTTTKRIENYNAGMVESGYYGSSGNVVENDEWNRTTEYVEIKPSTQYSMFYPSSASAFSEVYANGGFCWYDQNKSFISRTGAYPYTSPNNARYFLAYAKNTLYDVANIVICETSSGTPSAIVPFGYVYEDKMLESYSDSFSYVESLLNGILVEGFNKSYTETDVSLTLKPSTYRSKINIDVPSASWKLYIGDVEPCTIYKYSCKTASGCDGVYIYDSNGIIIDRVTTDKTGAYIVTPVNAKEIAINIGSSDDFVFKKVTQIIYSGGTSLHDFLTGKKLYCGGDSITAGANVGTFPDTGYKKTYGGYVAERCSMDYVSDGIGGSTMGNVTVNGVSYSGYSVSRYQSIPADADYITIWFGWNDEAYGWKSKRDAYCYSQYGAYYDSLTAEQQAEVAAYHNYADWRAEYIGTINDNDNTTWCGAWNIVLGWILANRGMARVGIVIAYGMESQFYDALINVCKKFGVPYIKSYDVHEFFSVGHSDGIGTDQATARKELYTLDGTHPNELGYEMMSTAYEQFLRKL